jgi:hypothetical protein
VELTFGAVVRLITYAITRQITYYPFFVVFFAALTLTFLFFVVLFAAFTFKEITQPYLLIMKKSHDSSAFLILAHKLSLESIVEDSIFIQFIVY